MSSPIWHGQLRDREPLSVVVVGGSLAGLMHGIMIKRLGHNVRILERGTSSSPTDQAAGMGTGPEGRKFFEAHDHYPEPYSFACPGFQFLDQAANVKRVVNMPLNLTSWNVLYYRLRANFDSRVSDYCPTPPEPKANEGRAVYHIGKKCINVTYSDRLVTVEYEDLIYGGGGSVQADLVIAADGSKSSVRQCLVPKSPYTYSGYVAWRGTVAERDLSEETRRIFDKRFNAFTMKRSHIVGYAIPGPKGALETGSRLFNFVWYFNCSASSTEFRENMTDIDGHLHRSTLPIGKMRPEVWARHKAYAAKVLTPPFLEIVNKTTQPFISAVNDCAAPQASFFDGRLLLVGEALTLLRPHTGSSFNHAAVSCLLLEKVLKGDIDIARWESDVLRYREKTMLLTTVIGCYFQFGILSRSFLFAMLRYILVLLKQLIYGNRSLR